MRRLIAPLKEFGIGAGLLYLLSRALPAVSRRCRLFVYELVVQPVPAQPARMMRALRGIEVRELGEDAPELARMPVPPAAVAYRLRQGSVCLGAFRRGDFIGYLWLSFDHYDEDEVRCRFILSPARVSAFDYDVYLFPEHRLGLAFLALWEGANRYLRGRDIRQTFSRVSRFNTASRRAHGHLGCQVIGRALFLRLWRAELMLSTLAPYVGASFRRGARVRLTLHHAPGQRP